MVGDREKNDTAPVSYRIHIDKFTGSVWNAGLFSEKNVSGDMVLKIVVKENSHKDRVCGILLMALRDLAIGTMSVGGGYNIGKGMIQVSKITVSDAAAQTEAELDFVTGTITDDAGMIARCMTAVNKTEEQ